MKAQSITLFLSGDVMTGRGIDQILPHPSQPHLFEPYIQSALEYVGLAERKSGKIRSPVDYAYIWGDALVAFDQIRPDVRLINLETAVTTSEYHWPGKGIHYRMHPANVPALTAAKLDCCVLANNHVLDWGRAGLVETLDVLHAAGLHTAGAGHTAQEASAPACIDIAEKGRVLLFALCVESSGVLREWAAIDDMPGVQLAHDLSRDAIDRVAYQVKRHRCPGDIVVVSIHWGANWGFDVSHHERTFAQLLIEEAGAHIVHGHSSHHVKGIEVYRDRLILYGCGDFLNDYEGIGGHEHYRADLSLMYFPTIDLDTGKLLALAMVPTQIRHFQVKRAPEEGVHWLLNTLNREGANFGTRFASDANDFLWLI